MEKRRVSLAAWSHTALLCACLIVASPGIVRAIEPDHSPRPGVARAAETQVTNSAPIWDANTPFPGDLIRDPGEIWYQVSDDFVETAAFLQEQEDILPRQLSLAPIASPAASRRAFGIQPQVDVTSTGTGRVRSILGSLFGATSSGIDRFLIVAGITKGQKRQQTASENNIDGKRKGQTPGGSHWIPAREDLDTMLSKIDSRLVERVTVTKGPYNVMEGPGLAFYDVELLRAPRSDNGYQSGRNAVLEYQTNGQQWHGRQTIWGGSVDWGYRIGYGHRTGSDYDSGDNTPFRATYNSRLPDLALGADLTDNSTIDFNYLRLDETDVEFAGQAFDIDFLVTDAYEVRYVLEGHRHFDRLELETWYNRTRFEGPTNENVTNVNPLLIISGETDVDAMSTGFTLVTTWGDAEEYLKTGTDFRYGKQRLNEFDTRGFPGATVENNFPIPRSHSSNPGIFAEMKFSPNNRTVVRSGARVDWVSTNADESVPGIPPTERRDLEEVLNAEFDQHFNLWSAFLMLERQLDRRWTAIAAAGHAMRPPTMTELYAIQPFLAVMPQFLFNKPFGNPNLDPERLWQLDLGLRYESRFVRGGISGFYGWVQDYITFDASPRVIIPNNFAPVNYTWTNTALATISGGEAYCELEWTGWMSTFAGFSYVEGRDHSRLASNSPIRSRDNPNTTRSQALPSVRPATQEEPLPVMPPLESRLGMRIHDPQLNPRWQVEFSTRIVDNQDRVATSLVEQLTPGFTVLDIRGYWQATERLVLTTGVVNVGDRNYQEHFDPHRFLGAEVFQPGVNFYFGTEWNF